MCPEFLLALIYLTIILIINYLLITFLKEYFTTIFFLVKLKRIFSSFDKKETKLISILYETSIQEIRNENFLEKLKNFSKSKDILIIGNIYKYISTSENFKQNGNLFYFQLLQKQYLSDLHFLK